MLALSQIAGSYDTRAVGQTGQFSPLIVNGDGSIVIAGALVSATYAPTTGSLTILPATINGQVVSGTLTFAVKPSGSLRFAGTLTVGSSATPFIGDELPRSN